MEKEQKLYNKFVDVLDKILDDKPSAQHLSVILNFLKYTNLKNDEEETEPKEEVQNGITILKLPFDDIKINEEKQYG